MGDEEGKTYRCCTMSAERSGCCVEINATTNVVVDCTFLILFVLLRSQKLSLSDCCFFYFFSYFIRVKVADICTYSTFSTGRFFFFF